MIMKYTVKRIAVDYYTISEQELVDGVWFGVLHSWGGQWPEYDIPEQAQKRNPRKSLYKDGDSYTFTACVYWFPEPRLMGKFADYKSAYGWMPCR